MTMRRRGENNAGISVQCNIINRLNSKNALEYDQKYGAQAEIASILISFSKNVPLIQNMCCIMYRNCLLYIR